MNYTEIVNWLVQALLNSTGGTVRVADGQVPTSGYAVGGKLGPDYRPAPELTYNTPEEAEAWVLANWPTLSTPGAHVGVWASDRGMVADCSEVRESVWSALNAAKARKEDAIWDIRNNREIRTSRTLSLLPSK